MGTLATYKPLYVWCSPASIPQIVAHIQDYLVKNPIVSTETVAEIVVQSLQEHPELINGAVIPITEDSAQTIKEYIDALPSLDGYTKAETDALLLLKQNLLTWDQTPTVGSSNPVTSEGIKAAISASAAALADLISTKADIASVYTKATTDALLLQKADAATTYSKNAVDALLDTKVDINDTYTRADIDLMKQVDKANTAIVTDGTAPFNIAAGQYVYVNDILYMATEPIPEGDPLIPGTNIALNPKGVTNVIGDGLQNLAHTVGQQSDQIANQGKAIAKVENGTTATQTINPGDYVYRNGTLYKYGGSTIAYGDPIPTFSTSWIVSGGIGNTVVTKANSIDHINVESNRQTGWVLRFNGVDNNANPIMIGFDATTGIYCYYNNEQLWQIPLFAIKQRVIDLNNIPANDILTVDTTISNATIGIITGFIVQSTTDITILRLAFTDKTNINVRVRNLRTDLPINCNIVVYYI